MRVFLKIQNKLDKWKRALTGQRRGHYFVLKEALDMLLTSEVESPVLIETGCVRRLHEGTESTYTISSAIRDKGTFFTFELEPKHIATCKELCGDLNQYIHYVEGDSVENLTSLVADQSLSRIDFAFLDSVNDGDHIWKEFKSIEGSIPVGGILVVDDVIWADKGRVIMPFLKNSPEWDVRVHNVENGIAVALRLST